LSKGRESCVGKSGKATRPERAQHEFRGRLGADGTFPDIHVEPF
jgi:hypothetical protein